MSKIEDATCEFPQTITLAKRGDVLLCVGQGENLVKLLVVSSFMSVASPVFEAMFNGRFSEGQDLSSSNPRETLLPDDDPYIMTIVCRMIHMQTSDIPRQLEVDDFAGFAILCDKYDCIDAVRPWSRLWVLGLLPEPDMPGYDKLLMITYVLDLPDEFYKVTQSLLKNRTFSLNLEVAAHSTDFIPLKVFACLQKAALTYQRQAVEALNPRSASDFGSASCSNNCNYSIFLEYIKALEKCNLFPTPTLDLCEYQRRLQGLRLMPYDSCYSNYCICKKIPCITATIQDELDRVIDSVEGMCLDCVYPAGSGSKITPCRTKHSKLSK